MVWCGGCYFKGTSYRFQVNEPMYEYGNSIYDCENCTYRYKVIMYGAHLMGPFQCDLCVFSPCIIGNPDKFEMMKRTWQSCGAWIWMLFGQDNQVLRWTILVWWAYWYQHVKLVGLILSCQYWEHFHLYMCYGFHYNLVCWAILSIWVEIHPNILSFSQFDISVVPTAMNILLLKKMINQV